MILLGLVAALFVATLVAGLDRDTLLNAAAGTPSSRPPRR
jgi:hypothetical protein